MTRTTRDPASRLLTATFAACVFGVSALTLGCADPEKPRELVEVEAMWEDPDTRKVKDIPGARTYYEEAREFRYQAKEAFQEGDVDLAREKAIWSRLRYRTAVALARRYRAKSELDAANAKVAEVNPELTALNQERNKLQDEVGELKRKVAVANRKKEGAKRRADAMSRTVVDDDGADEAKRQQIVSEKLAAVERARKQAVAVNASEHAPGMFNRANNQLKSLRALSTQKPLQFQMILSTSESAIKDFNTAVEEARPGYKEELAKKDPAARRAALVRAASATIGADNVFSEGNAVRVVAPASFDTGSNGLNSAGRRYVDSIATLAKDYDEFSIAIEAYTSRGDATENLSASQIRARAVEDAFVAEDISRDRITSKGQGQDRIRFPDVATKNERFEVVFRR